MNVPKRGALIGVVALVAVVLSGCVEGPAADDEPEPEANVETAMQSFQAAMANGDDSKLKAMTGHIAIPGDDEFMPSDMTMDMTFEWGRDDVLFMAMGIDMGGMQVHVETWCTPDAIIIKWGSDAFEQRPPAPTDEDECSSPDSASLDDFASGADGESSGGPLGFFEQEMLARLEPGDVTTNDDGTVTATFTDPENGDLITVHVDQKSRVTRIEVSGDEGIGAFDVTYGARDRLEVPTPSARIPASIETDRDHGWNREPTVHTVEEVDALLPLDEFEARWVSEDRETDEKHVLATFPLIVGQQVQNGVTFEYHDVDGDGHISVGDRYEYLKPREPTATTAELREDLELYDKWAEGYANETPIPAPGVVGLLAVLGLALVLMRRRS